jgi:inosine-uridine nucleoside N-ribohydrolase
VAEPLRVILDVDTGVDDAMALALAVRLPGVELVAVTTVAGNVGIEHTTRNTRRVLAHLGAGQVPIHRGLSRPLAGNAIDARHVHGDSGLGDLELPEPAGASTLRRPFAPEALVDMISAEPGAITLVCTGPLTNLAGAIALDPELPGRIGRLVVMGGSLGRGNVTPYAEFNIAADPEAAAQVFAACSLEMVGLDVTHQVNFTYAGWERLTGVDRPEAILVHGASAQYFGRGGDEGQRVVHLHDPLAVGVALDPTLCTMKRGTVKVETATAWCAGRTTLDERADGPHAVCVEVDAPRFLRLFADTLGLPEVAS